MSDFFNDGWSIYIATISVLGIAGCLALLILASKRKVMSSDNSTGHVWDEDLRELNNPLPRWWMGLFVLTIVFGAGYLLLYPGLGSYKGQLKWTETGEYQAEVERAQAQLAPLYAKFEGEGFEQLAHDPKAMGIGERLFMNNCAQCHGSDARGSKGFPNLTDNDWLYGGAPEQIIESITNGRNGAMPSMAAAIGGGENVRNVANYVLSLSGAPHDAAAAQLGKPKFAVCAACHGADGKGNQTIGAPNLTDNIWLHGSGEKAVMDMINNGKNSQMPVHREKFSAAQIRVIAAYVWSLSHQDAPAAAAGAPAQQAN